MIRRTFSVEDELGAFASAGDGGARPLASSGAALDDAAALSARLRLREEELCALRGRADALEAQCQAHAELLHRVPDMVMVFDLAGSVVFVSPACESLLGYRPAELYNHALGLVLVADEHESFEAAVRRMLHLQLHREPTDAECELPCTMRHKSGAHVSVTGRGRAWQRGATVELIYSFRRALGAPAAPAARPAALPVAPVLWPAPAAAMTTATMSRVSAASTSARRGTSSSARGPAPRHTLSALGSTASSAAFPSVAARPDGAMARQGPSAPPSLRAPACPPPELAAVATTASPAGARARRSDATKTATWPGTDATSGAVDEGGAGAAPDASTDALSGAWPAWPAWSEEPTTLAWPEMGPSGAVEVPPTWDCHDLHWEHDAAYGCDRIAAALAAAPPVSPDSDGELL
jgi:PAS domain S-box-containing protein